MLIDTNVYSALDRGVSDAVDVLRGQTTISVPIIVVAELRFGFMNGTRQKENNAVLDTFLAQDAVQIIFPTIDTTDVYAELATYCRRQGRVLSHNDLWIAALARENGLRLVTFDKDFSVFSDMFGNMLTIVG